MAVDRLTALLDGPRARHAFVLRCLLDPPWSLRIADEAPLAVCVPTQGGAWLTTDGAEPVFLAPGCAAVVRGPDHYTMSDEPGRAPDIVIHPGQRCESRTGESLDMSMRLGVRTWGHAPDASTAMIVGIYERSSAVGADLLDSLPAVVTVERPHPDPLVDLLTAEISHDVPGQQAVLDRLLDALVIDTIRRWHAQHVAEAPHWWRAHGEPLVGDAIALMHDAPDRSWTIDGLARQVGTSRANLARRFHDVVGEPPITYLTRWRLSLAADLICQPQASVISVARAVGYGSPFALTTAFKRHYGLSPHQHRVAERGADRGELQPAVRT